MKITIYLSTILFLSSCAFHSGTITSNIPEEPVVHKDIAVGSSSTNIVFGIGGLTKDALISRARKNMILTRPLEGAEQYNNIEVNIKNTFYLIGRKTKVTIQADVIEPKDSITQPTYSAKYMDKIQTRDALSDFFSVGDSIILNAHNYPQGRIVRIHGEDSNNELEINYTQRNELKVAKVAQSRVFLIKQEHFGLKIGERYQDGVILGFGIKRVLIKTMLGNELVNYPE